MMVKNLRKVSLGLFVIILLCSLKTVNAQYQYEIDQPSRVYVGGSFGLQFGTEDIIDISPVIGFWLTPILTVGVGLTYQNYHNGYYDYSDNVYGARVFSRLYLMDVFYLHSEYEYLALEQIRSNGNLVQNYNSANFLLGIGYREWIGPNMFTSVTVLWNLNNRYDIGSNEPIYRVGFGIGI